MGAIRKPEDAQSSSHREEREAAARTWLGGDARGGERLARIFQVGRTARASELEAELAELRAKLDWVEEELSALRPDPDGSDARPEAAPDPIVIDLPRVVLPRGHDYRLSRCEGFAVYAGARLLGTVKGVLYHSRTDRPDVLEVRSGRLGRRLLLVPVSDIEAIEPDDEAVVVKETCRPPQSRERVRAHLEGLLKGRRRR
jgi:hypothetical protein